jgi:hypothetical protein
MWSRTDAEENREARKRTQKPAGEKNEKTDKEKQNTEEKVQKEPEKKAEKQKQAFAAVKPPKPSLTADEARRKFEENIPVMELYATVAKEGKGDDHQTYFTGEKLELIAVALSTVYSAFKQAGLTPPTFTAKQLLEPEPGIKVTVCIVIVLA